MLLTKKGAEKSGQRHDQHHRDDVSGRDPRDFFDRCAERASDLRQGHVDDGRIDRRHERAKSNGDRHDPLVYGRALSRRSKCTGNGRGSHLPAAFPAPSRKSETKRMLKQPRLKNRL